MEFNHSPAPWSHLDNYGLNETVGGTIHGDGKAVCLVMGKGIGKQKAVANAKLIAAAPELLEALIELTEIAKEAIDGLGDLSDAIDTAKAAIAKALGQQ